MNVTVNINFIQQNSSKISNSGYIILSSQEHRTQIANKKNVLSILQDLVKMAYKRPKIRIPKPIALSDVTKERRKVFKQKRKEVKASRSNKNIDY